MKKNKQNKFRFFIFSIVGCIMMALLVLAVTYISPNMISTPYINATSNINISGNISTSFANISNDLFVERNSFFRNINTSGNLSVVGTFLGNKSFKRGMLDMEGNNIKNVNETQIKHLFLGFGLGYNPNTVWDIYGAASTKNLYFDLPTEGTIFELQSTYITSYVDLYMANKVIFDVAQIDGTDNQYLRIRNGLSVYGGLNVSGPVNFTGGVNITKNLKVSGNVNITKNLTIDTIILKNETKKTCEGSCASGEIAYNSTHLCVCTSTDNWRAAALGVAS